jgi:hypothetical protein
VPAYRDGSAPYGVWTGTTAAVTPAWATGDGAVPHEADYAIIEVDDQIVNEDLKRIGDVVGTLGIQTQALAENHATLLGYPYNLDSGEKMHQVTAGSFLPFWNNTVLYGSDMSNGSSGGP